MTIRRVFSVLTFLLICGYANGVFAQQSLPCAMPEIQLTFTTIDVPGHSITQPNGINSNGDIVGFYGDHGIGPLSGFLYRSGDFTLFDYPSETVTVPGGINDLGVIVGYATQNADVRTTVTGFLYDGTTFTPFKNPNLPATYGLGINNDGVIVGEMGLLSTAKGFKLVNGRYRTIDFPGSYVYGAATGINNHGLIVGRTDDEKGYALKNGQFRDVGFPGVEFTGAFGVNDGGIVVGWYFMPGPLDYGFAQKNGKYVSFRYPGEKATFPTGISSTGQVVGAYTSDFISYHGFVTSPITAKDFDNASRCEMPMNP